MIRGSRNILGLARRWFATSLEEIEATIFEVLKQHEKVNPVLLSRTSAFRDLNLDSLDTIEVVVNLEEKFRIDLTEDDALKIHSVMDAINIFQKYKK
ncbi:unnamed protein product [Blepharisma stoltei]|uniref:Acyl carrier protein n=1 Tax=Blepharisma stoltei TaxID=1481888 RepID=A0AAU9II83_9CILI|nr:unnamed protein product [Blepharisma stoltei]